MMTISPPMSASQAADYYPGETGSELLEAFAADEIERAGFQVARSEWGGQIADKLELEGTVDPADFKKLLDGIDPADGKKLVRHRRPSESPAKNEAESADESADESAVEPAVDDAAAKVQSSTAGNLHGAADTGAARTTAIAKTAAIAEAAEPAKIIQTAQPAQTGKTPGTEKPVEIAPTAQTAPPVKTEPPKEKEKPPRVSKTAARRGCWDLTFNAPKSVSLAAIVGGDLRLIEVHRAAASCAMCEIERIAEARLGGTKPPAPTGKLLYASFEHYVARPDQKNKFAAVDLHTHHPTINLTFLKNGKSYALQPRKLYECQKIATAVYRLEMAKGMIANGYEIRLDEKTKAPEIAGISRAYIEAVSPRQTEIKAKAAELNITSTRGIAARYRSAKSEKSIDNIEFHRQIERQFDDQANAAVRKSLTHTNPAQPEIIEALEAEVAALRTQAAEKEAVRQAYYLNRRTGESGESGESGDPTGNPERRNFACRKTRFRQTRVRQTARRIPHRPKQKIQK